MKTNKKLCLKNRTGETAVTKYSSGNSKANVNEPKEDQITTTTTPNKGKKKKRELLPYFVMFLLSNYIIFLF